MRAMYRVHGAATRARLHKVCHMFRSHSVSLYCLYISRGMLPIRHQREKAKL
jgi:hypothetical protein